MTEALINGISKMNIADEAENRGKCAGDPLLLANMIEDEASYLLPLIVPSNLISPIVYT